MHASDAQPDLGHARPPRPAGRVSWLVVVEQAVGTLIGGGAALGAAGWLWKRWVDHRLQREMEHLKRDLSDSLAQRTRRADYVRNQIQHLYGPLAFLVESSARCIDTNNVIMSTYDKVYSMRGHSEAIRKEARETIARANEYMGLVVENNQEAVKLLRTGWGWLDADDVTDAGQYLTDVHRHNLEFRNEGKMLPIDFYVSDYVEGAPGKPSFIRPAFIARVRAKLLQKQRELAGLTGVNAPVAVLAGVVQAAALPARKATAQLPPEPDEPAQLLPVKLDGGDSA
jgi:hypothetical protein